MWPRSAPASSNDVYIQANTGNNANIVLTGTSATLNSGAAPYIINGNGGYYATINGPIVGGSNTAWLNDLTINFAAAGITAEEGQANFAVRVVNAATSTAETNISGSATSTFKNWRFNDITVTSGNSTPTAPVINSNPTNATIAAGQPVTFTSSASGVPNPTVQWYEGGTPATGVQTSANVGGGTLVTGATSPGLTFTTSSTAADNNNTYWAEYHNSLGYVDTTAATLTDTLAAPAITTQPTAQTITAGNNVTFTVLASGSPVPTVTWTYGTSSTNAALDNTPAPGTVTTTYNPATNLTTSTDVFQTSTSQNGEYFVATLSNGQGTAAVTTPAKLTVTAAPIAGWNFENDAIAVNDTPAADTGTGTASALGMTNSYNSTTSTNTDDVVQGATSDTGANSEADLTKVWRVRGQSPGNGWSSQAPIGTQGRSSPPAPWATTQSK